MHLKKKKKLERSSNFKINLIRRYLIFLNFIFIYLFYTVMLHPLSLTTETPFPTFKHVMLEIITLFYTMPSGDCHVIILKRQCIFKTLIGWEMFPMKLNGVLLGHDLGVRKENENKILMNSERLNKIILKSKNLFSLMKLNEAMIHWYSYLKFLI